jgi:hypothetical protein
VFTGGRRQGRYFAPDGRPPDAGYVLRQFQAALKAAGLPAQPFKALRHAYATLLFEQGVEFGVVPRILGHSNISTRSDVYAHFTHASCPRARPVGWTPYSIHKAQPGMRKGYGEGHRQGAVACGTAREGQFTRGGWSGRSDSNARPPEPHSGALPGCATPRRPTG